MLQSLALAIFVFFHAFYVSVTDIHYNDQARTLEIISRVFSSDFELALEKEYKQKINILKPGNKKKVNALIADYFKKHLILNVNGQRVVINYLGYHIEDDAAWCYFEVSNVPKMNNIMVKNDILFKEYPKQVNMLHISVRGTKKSVKLDNPEGEATFNFN